MKKSSKYFESFLSPRERGSATHELAKLGSSAVPILEQLFNGQAKNNHNISYKDIGAIDCGLITVKILGEKAKSLEHFVRFWIDKDHPYAIAAVENFKALEKETVISLTKALLRDPFSTEASYSIVKLGLENDETVLNIINKDSKALFAIQRSKDYLQKQNITKKST